MALIRLLYYGRTDSACNKLACTKNNKIKLFLNKISAKQYYIGRRASQGVI